MVLEVRLELTEVSRRITNPVQLPLCDSSMFGCERMELHHRPSAYETDELLLLHSAIYLLKILCFKFLLFGSPTWVRTTDQQINSLLLYRLSYQGIFLTTVLYIILPHIAIFLFLEETVRFELTVHIATYDRLANRCLRPLSQLSEFFVKLSFYFIMVNRILTFC